MHDAPLRHDASALLKQQPRMLFENHRMKLAAATVLLLTAIGCSGGASTTALDAGANQTAFYIDTGADEKAMLYNLVGRWYPQEEITRLSDRSLTAKEWCEHEPALIFVMPDKVEVRCHKGPLMSAAISETKQEKGGITAITLRSTQDAKLKQLRIHATGPKATISGSPCFEDAVEYARFPEFEILTREILGGQRCAQLAADELEKADALHPPTP
jgi:hypothetical protein